MRLQLTGDGTALILFRSRLPALAAALAVAMAFVDERDRALCYNPSVAGKRQRIVTTRIIRPGEVDDARTERDDSTIEERIEAVWQLTLACMDWGDPVEPRLQRAVSRVQRPRR